MIDRQNFAYDDYGEINAQYFAELRNNGGADADPSGWVDTYSMAADQVENCPIKPSALARYYIDEGSTLGIQKERVCELLSAWEDRVVSYDGVTLCPSCGNASLIALAALKALGVRQILFETPAYFATIEQAVALGLQFRLVPTFGSDNYALPDLRQTLRNREDFAVWLTHPRAGLGFNQDLNTIDRLLNLVGKRGYLVVDEATDQTFPALLGQTHQHPNNGRLLRLRSFTKGMGLNGIRLAAILHPSSLRQAVVDSLEMMAGSVDANSLVFVADQAGKVKVFSGMLQVANEQVRTLREKAERLTRGTRIFVNPLVNGYIGSMVLDLSAFGRTQKTRRARLLDWCRSMRTPVILGASMYFAKDPPSETVRLNFFSHADHVTRGIANILRFWNPH